MTFRQWVAGVVLAVTAAFAVPAFAQAPSGEAVFNARCMVCHEPPIERAPNRATLATLSQAQILDALNNGIMKPMSEGLSAEEKQAVAAFLSPGARRGAPTGPVGVDKVCAAHPPIRPSGSDWTSVGVDAASTRFQRNPGLKAADVPRLKVKWAFAMAGGGMPTVIGDWLFVTNRMGRFYALDAKTGCVHWGLDGAAARTTPMIIKTSISPSGWATFIGERDRTVRAFDAQTGKVIWKSAALEDNPVGGITGSPIVSGGQIFVPLTSGEEGAARQPAYPCCSFRGSLVALDLATGKTQWKTYMITEPLRPIRKNAAGTQMQGPAGAAIWSAPTVDVKRGLVLVATGDSYTEAETKGADAIVAMDIKTGQIRWQTQVTTADNFITGCGNSGKGLNCPTPLGPDHDFGASPILFKLKGGKDMVLSGQKSSIVRGMDADTGKLIWRTTLGSGSTLGGVEWGMAADNIRLYAANSDIGVLFDEHRRRTGVPIQGFDNVGPAKPGLSALDPATGKVIWTTPAPDASCKYAGDRSRDRAPGACYRAQSAAPSVMPGVVFSGTLDGWFRAYDAATGKIIWEDSTTSRTYDTVNAVKGQPGGNIDGLGPAIAGGMVYTMSGFNGAANTGANGVNVLLAYSVDGK